MLSTFYTLDNIVVEGHIIPLVFSSPLEVVQVMYTRLDNFMLANFWK